MFLSQRRRFLLIRTEKLDILGCNEALQPADL